MTAPGLSAAFPRRLGADVEVALSTLGPERYPNHAHHPLGSYRRSVPVFVDAEAVTIPYRTSHQPPNADALSELTATQRQIVASILTRHLDGFVRQRWMREIVTSTEPWAAPFVVQLLGEYVLEVVRDIAVALTDIDEHGSTLGAVYGEFAASNRQFLELTRRRATSYFTCYHSGRDYPLLSSYPAIITLDAIERSAIGIQDRRH